jgi:hypothetical protein
MSGSGETFDVSSLQYFDQGLWALVQRTISTFIRRFEELNKDVTLTRVQLQDCWFHALHREYAKILDSSGHMTEKELDDTKKLLSSGIEQVRKQGINSRH